MSLSGPKNGTEVVSSQERTGAGNVTDKGVGLARRRSVEIPSKEREWKKCLNEYGGRGASEGFGQMLAFFLKVRDKGRRDEKTTRKKKKRKRGKDKR